jgi:hypothetical protein
MISAEEVLDDISQSLGEWHVELLDEGFIAAIRALNPEISEADRNLRPLQTRYSNQHTWTIPGQPHEMYTEDCVDHGRTSARGAESQNIVHIEAGDHVANSHHWHDGRNRTTVATGTTVDMIHPLPVPSASALIGELQVEKSTSGPGPHTDSPAMESVDTKEVSLSDSAIPTSAVLN